MRARYSPTETEGLKLGSLLIHNDNVRPGIFQNSQVLVTRFQRTGIQGKHHCEGIIINKKVKTTKKGLQ